MFRYATVCSGIECVTAAWEPLGAEAVFFSEHNPKHPWPAKFLARKFPQIPNLGDMLLIQGRDWQGRLDVLWGSPPCQAFSLAGRRKGILDPRGALTMKFIDLADDIDPPVVCFENVPGVLTDGTNAFGFLLGGLAGEIEPLIAPGGKWPDAGWVLGPRRALAWRKLDAQHFGLPQHRDRIVLIASPRDSGIDPGRILFETRSVESAGSEFRGGRQVPLAGTPGCAGAYGAAIRGRTEGQQVEIGDDLAFCIRASQGGSDKPMGLIWTGEEWALRNLTPLEAERLMGLPDGWTAIEGASDSVRYHALGNGVAVPMVRFVGERIIDEMRQRVA